MELVKSSKVQLQSEYIYIYIYRFYRFTIARLEADLIFIDFSELESKVMGFFWGKKKSYFDKGCTFPVKDCAALKLGGYILSSGLNCRNVPFPRKKARAGMLLLVK